ncbi:hypothetical protein AAKU67_001259 [Oxalobacteraceae bacterium GrIS 2.11]
MNNSAKSILAVMTLIVSVTAIAAGSEQNTAVSASPAPAVSVPAEGLNRYMVVRTFPPGALAGLNDEGEKAVNQVNSKHAVNWIYSYANEEKTKTFCIYEGPNEKAIRDAAQENKIPVDYIVKIPVVLGAH